MFKNNLSKQIVVIAMTAIVGIAGAVINNNQIKDAVREELDKQTTKNEES